MSEKLALKEKQKLQHVIAMMRGQLNNGVTSCKAKGSSYKASSDTNVSIVKAKASPYSVIKQLNQQFD